MSDLRNAMLARAEHLESSLRNVEEFEAPTAHHAIRRRHTARLALQSMGIIAAVGLLAGGGWLGQGILSGTPATTPGVSQGPTTPPTVDSGNTYEGRNSAMDDGEALTRAGNPATGEVWLGKPVQVTPAWANPEDWTGFWGEPRWYIVGQRGDNEILSLNLGEALVEVRPDGTPVVITAPYPFTDGGYGSVTEWPIASDTTTYYDSLALPPTFTASDGDVVDLRVELVPANPELLPDDLVGIGSWGGNAILQANGSIDGEPWGNKVASILEGATTEVRYFVHSPAGTWLTSRVDPVNGDIAWNEGYGDFAAADGFVDFYDQQCLGTLDYAVSVNANLGGDWVEAGTVGDRTVYVPAPSNALGQAMHAHWWGAVQTYGFGGPHAAELEELDAYLKSPAVIAVTSHKPDTWWLALNPEVSARAWC